MSTTVIEVTKFATTHPGTHDEVVQKMVAVGWQVQEETETHTLLTHDLIPGGQRIVHRS